MGATRATRCTCQCGGEQLAAALELLRRDVAKLAEADERLNEGPVSLAEGATRWKRGVAAHRNAIGGGQQ